MRISINASRTMGALLAVTFITMGFQACGKLNQQNSTESAYSALETTDDRITRFEDVPMTHPYWDFIETIAANGITGGCGHSESGAPIFCPESPTLRQQAAVFALMAKEGPSYRPAPCDPAEVVFDDLKSSSPYCPFIKELKNRGVIVGIGNGKFAPQAPLLRNQAAVVLVGTAGWGTKAACAGIFADVPNDRFCLSIEELYRRGVTAGCGIDQASGKPLYCPTAPTPREQMAALVVVTFGLKR